MNYLYRYLELLTPEELVSVNALVLPRRERQVLDALIAARALTEPRREVILDELAMPPSHFDKVCSVVLRRVYGAVVPAGSTALLYDLNRRGLYPNCLHELRRQEKELARAGIDERAAFYMECFTIMGRAARAAYDEDVIAELARKYDRLKPSPDNAIYFEACMISWLIWDAAARGTNREARPEVERRLAANAARIDAGTGPLARSKHYQACALHYAQLDEQPATRLEYLEMAAELCRRHPDVFSREEMVLAECKIAESHFFNSSRFDRAYRLYAALFRDHADVLRRDYYHTTKFIQLCIIRRRFTRAERMVRERFGRHLDTEHQSLGTMGAISWAKLLLASGRADAAKGYIDFGFRHNRKNFYVQYEIELRMLEAIYFALKGNDEFVENLAAKNIKYLRSKGYTVANSTYYPWLFKLLVGFIDERVRSVPLDERLATKLVEFNLGPAAVYGMLLDLVRCPDAAGGNGEDAGAYEASGSISSTRLPKGSRNSKRV